MVRRKVGSWADRSPPWCTWCYRNIRKPIAWSHHCFPNRIFVREEGMMECCGAAAGRSVGE